MNTIQNHYLFNGMIALVILILAPVVWKPRRIFEYPFFMTAVFAVFILPQAYSLVRFRGQVTEEDIANVFIMSILCLAAAVVGYRMPPSRLIVQKFSRPIDDNRVLHVGLAMIFIGVSATILTPNERVEFSSDGGLTGILTIFLFFANLAYPGFAICLMLLWRKVTPLRLFGVAMGLFNPMIAIMFGRREPTALLILTLLLSRFYATRKAPNPLLIFSGLVFMMLAIPATGKYRSLAYEGRLREVSSINLIQNFKEFVNSESILELRNAAALIRSTRLRTKLEYGAGYWDYIVFRFVPAQIVGRDVKDALMISAKSTSIYKRQLATNYEIPAGSTITGMGCAFEQFGWFGCLFFALLGMLFRSVWTAAYYANATFAQLFYIMISTSAMRTITHQTVDFLPGMLFQLVFIGGAVWYAGLPRDPNQQIFIPKKAKPAPRVYGRRPGHGMPLEPRAIADNPHNPRNRR